MMECALFKNKKCSISVIVYVSKLGYHWQSQWCLVTVTFLHM